MASALDDHGKTIEFVMGTRPNLFLIVEMVGTCDAEADRSKAREEKANTLRIDEEIRQRILKPAEKR